MKSNYSQHSERNNIIICVVNFGSILYYIVLQDNPFPRTNIMKIRDMGPQQLMIINFQS